MKKITWAFLAFLKLKDDSVCRLVEVGAEPFLPPVEADEVDGIETKVESWSDILFPALKLCLASPPGSQSAAALTATAAPATTAPVVAVATVQVCHGHFFHTCVLFHQPSMKLSLWRLWQQWRQLSKRVSGSAGRWVQEAQLSME